MEKDSGKEVPDHHEGGPNEEKEKIKESCKVEAELMVDEVALNISAPTTHFQDSKKHGKKEFPFKKKDSSSSSSNKMRRNSVASDSDSVASDEEKTQEDQEDSDSVASDEEHSADRDDMDEEPTADQDDGDAPHEEPTDDAPVVDLLTLISPSWRKTDKRSRGSIGDHGADKTLGTTSAKVDDNFTGVEKSFSTVDGLEGSTSNHNESNNETMDASNHSDGVAEETSSGETCQPPVTKQIDSD